MIVSDETTAFSDEQFTAAYPDGYADHFWTLARSHMVLDEIRAIERAAGRKLSRILEIGCGRGFVVEFMRRHGCACYGVELSKISDPRSEAAAYLYSGLDCVDLPEEFRDSVEAILLLDVIEHIEDPADFLSNIRVAYRNAKWVIVNVPARMEIWSNFDEHYGHFRRYDLQTTKDHLRRAGIAPLRLHYSFILPYLVMWSMIRLFGNKRNIVLSEPRPKFVHRAAAWYFRMESTILERTGIYGSSILAVGQVVEPSR